MVRDADVECRRYACLCICNMANAAVTQEQLVVHGALPSLLDLCIDNKDLHSQRQALLAISNMVVNESNHSVMINKGILDVLTQGCQSNEDDNRNYAAFALANMCSNPDFAAIIGNNGGIPPLIALSRSDNINVVCLGIAALRRLAHSPLNWSALIEHGILDSLAAAVQSAETDIQQESAACLCSLSLSAPHRVQIAQKCVHGIVQLSQSGKIEVARLALGALANLSEDVNTVTKLKAS